MLLDIGHVAENALTLLILVGFGYLVYYGFKNNGQKLDFKGLFGKKIFGGKQK